MQTKKPYSAPFTEVYLTALQSPLLAGSNLGIGEGTMDASRSLAPQLDIENWQMLIEL